MNNKMDPYYARILASEKPYVPTDPATRTPLLYTASGVGMRHTDDVAKSCSKCVWGTPADGFDERGMCYALKNSVGNIWRRDVRDFFGTTCDKFEAGQRDFRKLI